MEKLYTSKTFLKMAGGGSILLILPPWIRPWPEATETIKRVRHISVTGHHYFCSFLLKGRVKRSGGPWLNAPLNS